MKLMLINREKLQAIGAALVDEFDNLVSRIRASWNVEHNEDGTHKELHTNTVTTGRVVYDGIVTDKLMASVTHNYAPPGLDDAAVLRLDPQVDGAMVTGLQVPQDLHGTILDGRVLIVENITEVGYAVRLAHDASPEGQASAARNRFRLPRYPALVNAQAEFVIHPASFVTLIYNALKARWIIASQTLDQSIGYFQFSVAQNVITMPRAIKTFRLLPTAANLYINGFESTAVPDDEVKTVVNDGTFEVSLIHAASYATVSSRVYCPAGVRYILNPRESVQMQKVRGGGWRVLSKADQWIDMPYNAGWFSAYPGTWTVTAGNVATLMYQVDGNKMTVTYVLQNTTPGGGAQQLIMAIPDGRIAARTVWQTLGFAQDSLGLVPNAICTTSPGSQFLIFYKDASGATVWGTGVYLYGQIILMIKEDYTSIEIHSDVTHADAPHADAEHVDVAHLDVVHNDVHYDVAHGDAGHADLGHADTHSDDAHSDTHWDSAHVDMHQDVAHGDIAHGDQNHGDGHTDSHADAGHLDAHTDTAHIDQAHGDAEHNDIHQDFFGGGTPPSHWDSHGDYPHQDGSHGDVAHDDVAHQDVAHGDTPHGDDHDDRPSSYVPHSDVPHTDTHTDAGHEDAHLDTAHVDTHSDAPHSDGSHTDAAHSDGHADVPHTDQTHSDQGHSDTGHGDAAHQDAGLHNDANHTDI